MRALAAVGRVPLARVLAEHKAWLFPVAVLVAVNVGLLVGVVVPLSRTSATAEGRAAAARNALATAEREFERAKATRDGQSLATTELQAFYGDVLPRDFRSAARITHVRLAQLAETHGVRYQRMSADPERERDSTLEHLQVTMELSGDYNDIRAFLHALETSSDFVVIDNMQLGSGDDSEGLTWTLELSTYYLAGKNAG